MKTQNIKELDVEMAMELVRLQKETKIYKKALELMAISYFGNVECIRFANTGFQANSNVEVYDYFIQQAKDSMKYDN